jgi:hypothetical protein
MGDNINMDRKEIVWAGVDWFGQAQDTDVCPAMVIAVMNLQVTYNLANFLTI